MWVVGIRVQGSGVREAAFEGLGRFCIGVCVVWQKYSDFSLDAGAVFSCLNADRDFDATVCLGSKKTTNLAHAREKADSSGFIETQVLKRNQDSTDSIP